MSADLCERPATELGPGFGPHHWHLRSRQSWGEPSSTWGGSGQMYESEVCCHCGQQRVKTFTGARPEGCGAHAPLEWRLKEVRLLG